MQALGDSGCVTLIFHFQGSPEILGVSSSSGEIWQEISLTVYLKCRPREIGDIPRLQEELKIKLKNKKSRGVIIYLKGSVFAGSNKTVLVYY